MNNEQLKVWASENLLTKQQAIEVTGQSVTAFNQSVDTGKIKPFYDQGEDRSRVRLYLKDDVDAYAKAVAERRNKLKNK